VIATVPVGILDMHLVMAPLLVIALAWARSLRRERRAPRMAGACAVVAVVTIAAEVAVQLWALHRAVQDVEPEEKATRIARGVALGLNAGAAEIVVLLIVLAALAALAIRTRRRANT
jgi:hypothetical protein